MLGSFRFPLVGLFTTIAFSLAMGGCSPPTPDIPETTCVAPEVVPAYDVLALNDGEDHACALGYDGNHFFVGCNVNPARIVKVDGDSLKRISGTKLKEGRKETRVHALVAGPGYVLHGSHTDPAIFTKVEPSSMTEVCCLTGKKQGVSDAWIRPLITDGEFVYAGCDTVPGKVVKIDPGTLKEVASVTFKRGDNNVYSLAQDGRYLYAGCETRPGRVVKIDPTNMKWVASVTLDKGEDKVFSLACDKEFVYAGCHTDPVRVVKIHSARMKRVASLKGSAGESFTFASLYDGGYLYVGCWTSPARILKIDPVSFAKVETMCLPTVSYTSRLRGQTLCLVRYEAG